MGKKNQKKGPRHVPGAGPAAARQDRPVVGTASIDKAYTPDLISLPRPNCKCFKCDYKVVGASQLCQKDEQFVWQQRYVTSAATVGFGSTIEFV